jgi:hypothetical protein
MDIVLAPNGDNDDDDAYYDANLGKLIEEYGKEQRKEGYMKGFDDGLEDAMVASDTEYKANG